MNSGSSRYAASIESEDRTPHDWVEPRLGTKELLKRCIRRLLYPGYLGTIARRQTSKWNEKTKIKVDQWYWGYRGFDQHYLKVVLNRSARIRDSRVLVLGCGTGRDIGNWASFRPARLVGVDLFNYRRAWKSLTDRYSSLTFAQSTVSNLNRWDDASFDIVGSDNVFEHLRCLAPALTESYRVLRPGGALYAAFAPMWYCWGGDHVSGSDSKQHGYNHLLLEPAGYLKYLSTFGQYSHNEDDGRTWIENRLFSYLTLGDYLKLVCDAGFSLTHVGVVIHPTAVSLLTTSSVLRDRLLSLVDEFDLVAAGACIIAIKPKHFLTR